jgi:hypothetical protein
MTVARPRPASAQASLKEEEKLSLQRLGLRADDQLRWAGTAIVEGDLDRLAAASIFPHAHSPVMVGESRSAALDL